jgi:hypothetical protein
MQIYKNGSKFLAVTAPARRGVRARIRAAMALQMVSMRRQRASG